LLDSLLQEISEKERRILKLLLILSQ